MSDGLQIVISADIQDLQTNLNKAEKATEQFAQTSGNKLKKGAADGAYALTSLSRVAQDIPFGFIAIQNNITPVFESFGQLSKNTGGTINAFKALGASLAGPAGIAALVGVLTGAITGLIQKYGSLNNAMVALSYTATDQQKNIENLNKTSIDSIVSTEQQATKIKSLIGVLDKSNSTRNEQLFAYRELKKIAPGIIQDIDEETLSLQKNKDLIKQRSDEFLKYIELRGQEEALTKIIAEVSKKQLEAGMSLVKAATQETTVLGNVINYIKGFGNISLGAALTQAELANETKKAQEDIDQYSVILQKVREEIRKLNVQTTNYSKTNIEEVFRPLKGELQTVERTNSAYRSLISNLNMIKSAIKKDKITESPTIQLSQDAQAAVNTTAILQEQYQSFANTISSMVSPAIDNFFSALENGQNIFKAIGSSLKMLVIDIVKTIAKAAILAAILNIIFPAGSKGAALLGNASGGFTGFFSSALGIKRSAAPSIGSGGSLQGGMQLGGQVVFVQRGYDLVGVLNAANGSIRNIG